MVTKEKEVSKIDKNAEEIRKSISCSYHIFIAES